MVLKNNFEKKNTHKLFYNITKKQTKTSLNSNTDQEKSQLQQSANNCQPRRTTSIRIQTLHGHAPTTALMWVRS
jgi:hypothetical protein